MQKINWVLRILFVLFFGIILNYWLNEVFNEIKVDISHGDFSPREGMSGWVHDRIYHDGWTLESRLIGLIYGIPVIILFLLTLNSLIGKKYNSSKHELGKKDETI